MVSDIIPLRGNKVVWGEFVRCVRLKDSTVWAELEVIIKRDFLSVSQQTLYEQSLQRKEQEKTKRNQQQEVIFIK